MWELQVRLPGSAASSAGGVAAAVAAAGAAAVEVSTTGFLCVTGAHAQRRVCGEQPGSRYDTRFVLVLAGRCVVTRCTYASMYFSSFPAVSRCLGQLFLALSSRISIFPVLRNQSP